MTDMATYSRILVFSVVFFSICFFSIAVQVSYDSRAITIDGERRIILSGSIHYPRSTPEMWPDLIKKAKDGGLNAIETYVFWNAHEPLRRQYDFSGNLDLLRFLRTIQDEGLYAILRIGPYVCAEWNFGGFPVWLHNIPGIEFRTNNQQFENEMKTFTTLIVDMAKHAGLFASDGGPIILAQIENEYGNVMSSYGDAGKTYINWCANFAESLNIGVPWIMCQQWDTPPSMIEACNGWYCDQYHPGNHNVPKLWTENWTGWYKAWGDQDPHRTAEDLAFAVARFFQYGGTLQNYYMYHGGTNFGRVSGGPYISTSYDYDAPLDEYGNLNQPKWGHLKQLHFHLMSMEKILTHGVTREVDYGNMMSVTIFKYSGQRVCFFGNANNKEDITISFEGNNFTIPAWSVSILPDCYTEVYNTARVNSQTSVMVKSPNKADLGQEPYNLKWKWRAEHFEHLETHVSSKKSHPLKDVTYATQLLDQKVVTNDTSDYLWYMTSVNIDKNEVDWKEDVTLQVHTGGPVLHAIVNGKHVGSQWGTHGKYEFVFEKKINLKPGNNSISLLSVTVGLQNYGAFFDNMHNGIVGPVKLISKNNQQKDLSKNQWVNKVGIHGIEKKLLFKEDCHYNRKWNLRDLPTNRMFIWYKTGFESPLGNDPVVLDLLGLGKGIAWVNGHNIGRYWPSYNADENGCTSKCDYRGAYSNSKCLSNCGHSSQRWYHVPRYFLRDEGNTLTLFEEFGGNPSLVSVHTVTIEKVCANTYEGNILQLSCQGGRVISDVKFASFGNPRGTCGSFEKGICESPNSLAVVQKACQGKESCLINVSETTFEASLCREFPLRLAVEAICSS